MIDPNSTENQTDLVDLIEQQKKDEAELTEKITSIVWQMKRNSEINLSDIPIIVEFIEKKLKEKNEGTNTSYSL